MQSRRRYIRHPTDIPIECHSHEAAYDRTLPLRNVSEGGLSFRSTRSLEPGTALSIRIPSVQPPFEANGEVVWCNPTQGHFDVGVRFSEGEARFRLRMVEQICQIESYRNRALREEGRTLSGEEAAREWIEKYASRFPSLID